MGRLFGVCALRLMALFLFNSKAVDWFVEAVILEDSSMKRHPHRHHVTRRADKTFRLLAYALATIILFGTIGTILASGGNPRITPTFGTTVEITASMSGFSQNTIRAKAGEEVRLRLTSLDHPYHEDGGGQHQWAVDELNVNLIAPPLGSETATFVVEQPGVYTFYCDICCGGRESPTMQGTLVVEI